MPAGNQGAISGYAYPKKTRVRGQQVLTKPLRAGSRKCLQGTRVRSLGTRTQRRPECSIGKHSPAPWEKKSRSPARGLMRRRHTEESRAPTGNQSVIFGYTYPEVAMYNPDVLTREPCREASIASSGREHNLWVRVPKEDQSARSASVDETAQSM
jgi:hypothetical protein